MLTNRRMNEKTNEDKNKRKLTNERMKKQTNTNKRTIDKHR